MSKNKIRLIKTCVNFSNEEFVAVVNLKTNWGYKEDLPEYSFPVYKPCCSFFRINKDGTKGEKISFNNQFPKLIIPKNERSKSR